MKSLGYFLAAATVFVALGFSNAHGTLTAGQQTVFAPFSVDGRKPVKIDSLKVQGGSYTITSFTQGSEGTVTLLPNNALLYAPSAGFTDTDNFSFTVSDPAGETATGTVLVVDFAKVRGNYTVFAQEEDGLYVQPASIPQSGGTLSVTSAGAFSFHCGFVQFSGAFDRYGHFYGYIQPTSLGLPIGALQLSFQNGLPAFTGSYTYGSSHAPAFVGFTGYRVASPGTLAGRYTMLIKAASTSGPQGTGWAEMTLFSSGLISITGQLNDMTQFSTHSALASDHTFQINFVGGEGLTGTVTFRDVPNVSDFDGEFANQYTLANGTTDSVPTVNVIGSRFTPGGPGKHTLKYSKSTGTATLTFSGGDFPSDVQATATVALGDAVTSVTAPVTDMRIYAYDSSIYGPVGGRISGHFNDSALNAARSFAGVVFQKQNIASGIFRGTTTDTGTFILQPQ